MMKFWDLVNAIREGLALDPEAGDFDYGEEETLSVEDEEDGDDSTGLVPGMEFLGILSEDEGEDGEDGENEENEDPEAPANPFGTTVSTAADMAAFIERNSKDL